MPPDELIRLIHATYAAPGERESDGELLRRYGSSREAAAFELLMQRYSDLVWRVCRAVASNHHAAEDAFQATFLALARKAPTVASGSVARWLSRVAYHAALKARSVSVAEMTHDPISPPSDDATERSDFARVLNEELHRLADRYRLPLLLCYFQDFTHAMAAERLGWPIGTVATRVARGRDRLRDRLLRRGIVLSSAGVATMLAAGPASALSPGLIPATAQAISTGSGLSPTVLRLTQGVLSAMTYKMIWSAVVMLVVAIAAGAGLILAASAEPLGRPAVPGEEKEKKPVGRTLTAGPGIQALVASSTDIIIADVLETSPGKAIEGARDTVKLKVVRTLLGRPAAGDTLSVYYHLLWSDEKGQVLEPRKFEKGKRYVIFLRSPLSRGPEGEKVGYELTDQWLAVLPDNVSLVKEIVSAVRVMYGDAQGEWSSTDGSIAGLQARLVAYREDASNGTPIIAMYLDLRNTAGSNNTVDFVLDGAKVDWIVSDSTGKAIAPTSPPGNWLPINARKLTLAAKESGRLKLTIGGGGIGLAKAGHLELASDRVWEFAQADKGPYFLSGKITIEATGEREKWSGTLALPRVRIPVGE